MFILDSAKKAIHNTAFIERYTIAVKPDAVLIVGGYSSSQEGKTLGKYKDEAEAKGVLMKLFDALSNDDWAFQMPDSELFHPQPVIKDARTRRKGGS